MSAIAIMAIFLHDIFSDESNNINHFLFSASISIAFFVATIELASTTAGAIRGYSVQQENARAIDKLSAMHVNEPDCNYIFIGEAERIALQYGALTGNKVAVLPRNYEQLDEQYKDAFWRTVSPYRIIESLKAEDSGSDVQ